MSRWVRSSWAVSARFAEAHPCPHVDDAVSAGQSEDMDPPWVHVRSNACIPPLVGSLAHMTEVMVSGPDDVYVERKGRIESPIRSYRWQLATGFR